MTKELKIEGMHCEHCVARIEKALSAIDGVKKVKVNLKKAVAKVECDGDVANDTLKAAIDNLGFNLIQID